MRAALPLVVAAAVLVGVGVVATRPQVAVTAADLGALGEGPPPAAQPTGPTGWTPAPAGTSAVALHALAPAEVVLDRDGAGAMRLGTPVEAVLAAGWEQVGSPGPDGCVPLRAAAGRGFRIGGTARDGVVVSVRLSADRVPGPLLPTGDRLGWSWEAVARDADRHLAERRLGGVASTPERGALVQEAVFVLPVDVWPTTSRSGFARAGTAGSTGAGPDPVELVLSDRGTGAVRAAELRTPASAPCDGHRRTG